MTATEEEAARLCPSNNVFENSDIRRMFMGRVFALVALQLSVVTASVMLCVQVDSIYDCLTAEDNIYLVGGALGAAVATYIISVVLYCAVSAVHKHALDIIILISTVTASSAVIFSILCTTFGVTASIAFLGITISSCLGISIFSLISTDELDVHQGFVFSFLWGGLSTAFAIWLPFSTNALKIAAGSISVITIFIMVYDIHRIMDRSENHVPTLRFYLDGLFELHSDIFIIFTILLVLLALLITGRCAIIRRCTGQNRKSNQLFQQIPPDDDSRKPADSGPRLKL